MNWTALFVWGYALAGVLVIVWICRLINKDKRRTGCTCIEKPKSYCNYCGH